MGIKFERIPAPVWVGPLIPVAAVIVTFLLTATLIVLVDANPLEAYYYFLLDPLSGRVSAIEVLVKSTPLLLTGAAVTFAFAGGYWNIGAEGQLYAGATAATAIGLQMHGVSPWVALPLMIIGG
ncbi:MAG: ABC transporter permease, partial [Calditrichaeota bacterium]